MTAFDIFFLVFCGFSIKKIWTGTSSMTARLMMMFFLTSIGANWFL